MENDELTKAIISGMNVMSSDDIKVPTKEIEALATFKDILRAILNGKLVLATPDKLIPPEEPSEGEK